MAVLCYIVTSIMLECGCIKGHPNDQITLAIFTFAFSYLISFICAATRSQEENSLIVLKAAFLTLCKHKFIK